MEGASSYSTFYEYDNKINFNKILFPEVYYKIWRRSDHNPTKTTSNFISRTAEYKYNSDGLPIEITKKHDGIIEQVSKLTYN
jgi:hypothetical protein